MLASGRSVYNPAGSNAWMRACASAGSAPARSLTSMRVRRPWRSSSHCAPAMSMTARRCPVPSARSAPATRRATSRSPTCTRTVSPISTPSHSLAAGLRKTASGPQHVLAIARLRQERRLDQSGAKNVDADDPQRLLPAVHAGFDLDHGARHRHLGQPRDLRIERFVEAGARAADGQVGVTGQGLQGLGELAERRMIDQLHRVAERHTERNREHRHGKTAFALPQGSDQEESREHGSASARQPLRQTPQSHATSLPSGPRAASGRIAPASRCGCYRRAAARSPPAAPSFRTRRPRPGSTAADSGCPRGKTRCSRRGSPDAARYRSSRGTQW